MLLTGAQILIECLLEQNVDTVFGTPAAASSMCTMRSPAIPTGSSMF